MLRIMNTVEKRDYIHNYLYRVDDENIDEIFKKVQTLVEKDITLTQAQEEEIEKRVMRHKNGESKSYSWSEVKKRAMS
jgi:isopropylmalate/homocitrate/citramalate synthase